MRNKPTAQSKRRGPKRPATPPETERSKLRRLVAHLQAAREEEYLRIHHAVHDELLSRLVRISMDLGELRWRTQGRARAWQFTWMGAAQRLKEAIQIVGGVRAQLRPPLLEHCGLEAAIGWTASEWTKRHGPRCEMTGTINSSRLTPAIALELFRLFEDGVRSLTENCEPACLRIVIASRGTVHCLTLHSRALPVNARQKLACSPAFLAVRERTRRLRGKLVVRDTPASGISLAITVPAGS